MSSIGYAIKKRVDFKGIIVFHAVHLYRFHIVGPFYLIVHIQNHSKYDMNITKSKVNCLCYNEIILNYL